VVLVAPVGAGLLVLFTMIALIGFAIRTPQPHDIPLGLVGPSAEIGQLSAAFGAKAPGALQLTTFPSAGAARAAIDDRSVDGALVLGAGGPRLIVAGAAGPAIVGALTGIVGGAFQAQGTAVTVETIHPFPAGDPDGLILFFMVLALLIASVVAGGLVGLGRALTWRSRPPILAGYAVAAGLVGMGTASWVATGYGAGFWAAAGLVALAAAALAVATAAGARLLGRAGVALAALVLVLFDVISSGGPLGSEMLTGFYRWLAQGMPADQLYSAVRGALFFGGAGVGGPVVVLIAWLAGGLALLGLAEVVRSRLGHGEAGPTPQPAGKA
jgi:hypothetical protein